VYGYRTDGWNEGKLPVSIWMHAGVTGNCVSVISLIYDEKNKYKSCGLDAGRGNP
jgi:hypothetical protein